MEAEHSCSGKAGQSRASQGDEGEATGSLKSQICLSTRGAVIPSSPPLSSGQPGLLLAPLLRQAKPWVHHFTPTSTSVHGLIILGRSIVVPKLPQLDTEEAIKVGMTAFVSALLVSGEHKLRLLTSIFSTQVLHLIIE